MSIYVSALKAGSNSFQTTPDHINQIATDFVAPGFIGNFTAATTAPANATGAFGLSQQGTPNMTLICNLGVAYVPATPNSNNPEVLRFRSDANATVTITANASGVAKYDWVYLNIDPTLAANPDVNGTTVGSIIVSRSTNAATDDGAVGVAALYKLKIAVVTVAIAATSITNGNIADARVGSGTRGALMTLTNSGSAGGTMTYVNLGGVKMCYGLTNAGLAGGVTTYIVNLPTGFFNTVQVCNVGNGVVNTGPNQYVSLQTFSATAFSFFVNGSGQGQGQYVLIGT